MLIWSHRIRAARPDDGVTLVEIVVSLLILAVFSAAVIPLFAQGLRISAAMSTTATATQMLGQQMELIRSPSPACGSAAVSSQVATMTDSQQVSLAATRIVGACPSSYPGTFRVDVNVRRTDSGSILSSASTLVYVTAG